MPTRRTTSLTLEERRHIAAALEGMRGQVSTLQRAAAVVSRLRMPTVPHGQLEGELLKAGWAEGSVLAQSHLEALYNNRRADCEDASDDAELKEVFAALGGGPTGNHAAGGGVDLADAIRDARAMLGLDPMGDEIMSVGDASASYELPSPPGYRAATEPLIPAGPPRDDQDEPPLLEVETALPAMPSADGSPEESTVVEALPLPIDRAEATAWKRVRSIEELSAAMTHAMEDCGAVSTSGTDGKPITASTPRDSDVLARRPSMEPQHKPTRRGVTLKGAVGGTVGAFGALAHLASSRRSFAQSLTSTALSARGSGSGGLGASRSRACSVVGDTDILAMTAGAASTIGDLASRGGSPSEDGGMYDDDDDEGYYKEDESPCRALLAEVAAVVDYHYERMDDGEIAEAKRVLFAATEKSLRRGGGPAVIASSGRAAAKREKVTLTKPQCPRMVLREEELRERAIADMREAVERKAEAAAEAARERAKRAPQSHQRRKRASSTGPTTRVAGPPVVPSGRSASEAGIAAPTALRGSYRSVAREDHLIREENQLVESLAAEIARKHEWAGRHIDGQVRKTRLVAALRDRRRAGGTPLMKRANVSTKLDVRPRQDLRDGKNLSPSTKKTGPAGQSAAPLRLRVTSTLHPGRNGLMVASPATCFSDLMADVAAAIAPLPAGASLTRLMASIEANDGPDVSIPLTSVEQAVTLLQRQRRAIGVPYLQVEAIVDAATVGGGFRRPTRQPLSRGMHLRVAEADPGCGGDTAGRTGGDAL